MTRLPLQFLNFLCQMLLQCLDILRHPQSLHRLGFCEVWQGIGLARMAFCKQNFQDLTSCKFQNKKCDNLVTTTHNSLKFCTTHSYATLTLCENFRAIRLRGTCQTAFRFLFQLKKIQDGGLP